MFSSKNITKNKHLAFIKGLAKDRIYKNPNINAPNGGKLMQIIKMIGFEEMELERLFARYLATKRQITSKKMANPFAWC